MAISYADIEEFAELWKAELDIPFAVYGVIPNYVKRDKFEILTWAGMNRVRMGIQSGSQEILDFYRRPTPPEKIMAAGEVIASFSPKYHIPPAYDIIMDNPIETRENVIETLELLYAMPRPYTLFIYSLRVIPNTGLERGDARAGDRHRGDLGRLPDDPARVANLLLYVLALLRPPRRLFDAAAQARRVERDAPARVPAHRPCAADALPRQAGVRPRPLHGLLDHDRLERLDRLAAGDRRPLAAAT